MENSIKKAELPQGVRKFMQSFGKYKYAAGVLLLGVLLMLWPQKEKSQDVKPKTAETEQTILQMQEQLQKLLTCVDGAGRVEVLLSLQTGTEYEYQSNRRARASG